MKYINKKICFIIVILFMCNILVSCGKLVYSLPYDQSLLSIEFNQINDEKMVKALSFASDLCVIGNTNIMSDNVDMSGAISAGLFDLNNQTTMYAKNPHEQLHIASLVKIMTAHVALKYGDLNQYITATKSVVIHESGAQLSGLKEGDVMTLEQALHLLLMYSANDAAMLIAESVGGTVDNFIRMMNEEAKLLGATNTNFENPTGLTASNQYSTIYDIYLILNEALAQERFKEIIGMSSYDSIYQNSAGVQQEISIANTNLYIKGDVDSPTGVTVLGGKTGTTTAAGHCLAIFAQDTSGNVYIAIILGSQSRTEIYEEMSDLLKEIMA